MLLTKHVGIKYKIKEHTFTDVCVCPSADKYSFCLRLDLNRGPLAWQSSALPLHHPARLQPEIQKDKYIQSA